VDSKNISTLRVAFESIHPSTATLDSRRTKYVFFFMTMPIWKAIPSHEPAKARGHPSHRLIELLCEERVCLFSRRRPLFEPLTYDEEQKELGFTASIERRARARGKLTPTWPVLFSYATRDNVSILPMARLQFFCRGRSALTRSVDSEPEASATHTAYTYQPAARQV